MSEPRTDVPAPEDSSPPADQAVAQTAAAPAAEEPTPVETAQPERSLAARCFDALAAFALVPLTLLMACQTFFGLDARALWFSDEVRHANVYENMLRTREWIVPFLNGVPYPDKPPVYFWFLALLDTIPGVDAPMLFPLGAAVSGLMVLWATWLLARVTGHDRRIAFAAGIILLGGFYFLGVTHYSRMDLFFTTLITLAHVCLYCGWRKEQSWLLLPLGYVFAAVATLVKGPLGLAFPLITGILFLLWRGTPRRLNRWDAIFAFLLLLVIPLAWLGAAWAGGHAELVRNIFSHQIVDRATNAWHHGQPWWHYLATLPAAWMPWTLLLLFAPWGRLLQHPVKSLAASRKAEGEGHAYIWIGLVSGLVLLSALSIKIVIYLLPLFPLLAIVSARAVLALSRGGSRFFFGTVALLLMVLALAFGAAAALPWVPAEYAARIPQPAFDMLMSAKGLPVLALVCFVFSVALWKGVDRNHPEAGVLLWSVFGVMLALPLSMYSAPSLDAIMSPKAQGSIMGEYVRSGYHPVAFKTYSGTYTYYAGADIDEVDDWAALDAAVAANNNVVVAMRDKYVDEWTTRPAGMRLIHTQWIVDRKYVLLVRSEADKAAAEAAAHNAAPQPETDAGAQDAKPATAPSATEEACPPAQPGADAEMKDAGAQQPAAVPAPANTEDGHTTHHETPPAPVPAEVAPAAPAPVPAPEAAPLPAPHGAEASAGAPPKAQTMPAPVVGSPETPQAGGSSTTQ